MAWQSSITVKPINNADNENIYVHVDYYDDVAPSTIIYSKDFKFLSTQTTAQMQAAVIFEGQKARSLNNKTNTLIGQVPPATVLAIP
jgi:hypothetical protein